MSVRAPRHRPAGALPKFEPVEYQREFLDALYPVDGERKYSQAILSLPRKSGKTTFTAGLALWHLFFQQVAAAQVVVVATNATQAGILQNKAARAIRRNPALMKYVKIRKDRIEVPNREAAFCVLSAVEDSALGTSRASRFTMKPSSAIGAYGRR